MDIFKDYEPKVGILDLGTASLQRIIDDMKSISQLNQDDHVACRKTDLVMKYCDYITDTDHKTFNNRSRKIKIIK